MWGRGPITRTRPTLGVRTGRAVRASASGVALGVVVVGLLDPAHELAQPKTSGLDRVFLGGRTEGLELGRARVLVVDEPLGERTALDVGQDVLHAGLHRGVDDCLLY